MCTYKGQTFAGLNKVLDCYIRHSLGSHTNNLQENYNGFTSNHKDNGKKHSQRSEKEEESHHSFYNYRDHYVNIILMLLLRYHDTLLSLHSHLGVLCSLLFR